MRKSILFLIAFVCFISCIHAQIPKGSLFLGGGFGLSNRESEYSLNPGSNQKDKSLFINPTIGTAISQNTILGLGFIYVHNNNDVGQNQERKSNTYGINTFLRKYLVLGKKFYLFGEGELGYSNGKEITYSNSTETFKTESNQVFLGIAPGISYAVSKWFHLEAELNNLLYFNYATSKSKNLITQNDSYSGKAFNAGTSLSSVTPLTVGFRFLISK